MKSIICVVLVVFLFVSCSQNQYRPRAQVFIQKPGSKVEKAWVARNQFDQERRLLIPKLGGARWGAVQEYKEDGTIEFKDWWERDVKIEDLEASPSTAISKSWGIKKQVPASIPRLGLDQPVDFQPPSAPLPPFGTPPASSDIPSIPALPPIDAPALPPIDGLPPIDAPSLPTGPTTPTPSPFAPLPGALPGAFPAIDEPNNELPAVPPGGEGIIEEENPLPELPADPFEKVP